MTTTTIFIAPTSPAGRGPEGLTNATLLDVTPLGRQEEWEDSPAGGPRSKPFVWWRRP